MKNLALARRGAARLSAEAPLPAARYPQAVSSDVGNVKLFSESDENAAISGVQIFLSAGLDKESDSTSGVAALVAECIVRTPVDARPAARPSQCATRSSLRAVAFSTPSTAAPSTTTSKAAPKSCPRW